MVALRSKTESVTVGSSAAKPRLSSVRRRAGGGSYNAPMALPPEVCIRGAGIVGRTLALLLARERIRVALVAPAPAAAHEDVRAYALNAASRTLLQSLRAWPDAAHATP